MLTYFFHERSDFLHGKRCKSRYGNPLNESVILRHKGLEVFSQNQGKTYDRCSLFDGTNIVFEFEDTTYCLRCRRLGPPCLSVPDSSHSLSRQPRSTRRQKHASTREEMNNHTGRSVIFYKGKRFWYIPLF